MSGPNIEEALPCPYCGTKYSHGLEIERPDPEVEYVRCLCGVTGPAAVPGGAVKMWNELPRRP